MPTDTENVRLSGKTGSTRTPQNDAIDPTATLAVHCRNRFQPLSKCWFEPLRCRLLILGSDMKRREFITLLGGAAATWPFSARAQQRTTPVVAFIVGGSADASAQNAVDFRKGYNETGFIEGQNVTVEYHWLGGQYDRLPVLMT